MSNSKQILQDAWRIHQSGDIAEAMERYRGVLASSPKDPDALVFLGIALFDQRDFDQSVAVYREALAVQPEFPIAWNNLGNSLRMLGRTDEAEHCFATALEQRPTYLSALKNRGTLWIWSGEIERGLAWYQKGLEVDPNNAELHRNLGVIHLLLGNYDIGWNEYRWRWRMPGAYRPQVASPVWQGQPLDGKSILLYPEQGNGDAIHFVRVADALSRRGANVILQCSDRFVPLFSSVPGISRLHLDTVPAPTVDYHVSMIEAIDVIFTQTAEIEWGTNLFRSQGRYLTVSDDLIDYWRRWLDKNTKGIRIGINWQGNPDHHADIYRSVPLNILEPLTQIPGSQLINLQFGYGAEQLQTCPFADSIVRLPDHVDSEGGAFTDTAAIVQNLDHVVTTDTAVAHLAGAVGATVTMMLGRVPDWRWLTETETTPWYPTMQLVRQQAIGHWNEVVERVRHQLTVSKG